jgi:hypothetical protein
MQTYKESSLTLTKDRLLYFDVGYKYSSVISLISSNPTKIKYGSRRVFAYLLEHLGRSKFREGVTISLLTKEMDFLPFCLLVYHPHPENLVFNFLCQPKNVIRSQFVEDLASICHYRLISDEYDLLSEKINSDCSHFIIAEYNSENETKALISKLKEMKFRKLFLLNYGSSAPLPSLYFFVKSFGLSFSENADGVAVIY